MDTSNVAKLQRRIVRRAEHMKPSRRSPVVSAFRGWIAPSLGLFAVIVAWRRRRSRPARRLRNDQGVGPAHIKGVPKGEELALKHPHVERGHAAGRPVGSIQPA
jgi:hypothetical protein